MRKQPVPLFPPSTWCEKSPRPDARELSSLQQCRVADNKLRLTGLTTVCSAVSPRVVGLRNPFLLDSRRRISSPAWQRPQKKRFRGLRWVTVILGLAPCVGLYYRDRQRRRTELSQRASQITDFVYLDLAKGDRYLGRLLIGLFGDVVPLTVNNFIQLVQGYPVHDKILGYKNTLLHAIIPGKLILGGDVVTGKGSDSLSIYGPMFPDENFSQRFIRQGDVAMFSRKPNGNGSMFLISLRPLTEENGRFVVFGTVVKGIELLSVLTADVNPNRRAVDFGRVMEPVRIVSCGLYTESCKGPPSYLADREQQSERKITFSTGHAHQPLSDIWRVSQLALDAARRDFASNQQYTDKIQQSLRDSIRPFLKDRRHDIFLSASPEERTRLHRVVHEQEQRRSDPSLHHRRRAREPPGSSHGKELSNAVHSGD